MTQSQELTTARSRDTLLSLGDSAGKRYRTVAVEAKQKALHASDVHTAARGSH
jgi:hypothetical protein